MEKNQLTAKQRDEEKKETPSREETFSMPEGEVCSAEFSAGCISTGEDS